MGKAIKGRGNAMKAPFEGRQALVTGGTSGIGRGIALALAESGCRVTATGVSSEEFDRYDAPADRFHKTVLDVTDPEAVDRVVASLDRLDILVNGAGILARSGAEHQIDAFRRVIDVNLNGTMRMCVACRPLLAAARGCVVNIASMLSFFGSGTVPAYSSSKGGVAQLTKSLAIAWAREGIRVNALAPGWVDTPFTDSLRGDSERNRAILERTPMARWGRPEDIAGPALFLCSPAAAFVTGVILPVDGGYSIA